MGSIIMQSTVPGNCVGTLQLSMVTPTVKQQQITREVYEESNYECFLPMKFKEKTNAMVDGYECCSLKLFMLVSCP